MINLLSDLNKIIIVGRGSKLYQQLKSFEEIDIVELSTIDAKIQISNFDKKCLIIIFSLFDGEDLRLFLSQIKGKSITVGSVSALSRVADRFKYAALKKRQLKTIHKLNDMRHKIILFGDFSEREFIGDYYLSNSDEFWPAVWEALGSNNICSISAKLISNRDTFSGFLSFLDFIAAPISTLFLKKLSNRVYGYIDAKNYKPN